jgi:hypothetical protein
MPDQEEIIVIRGDRAALIEGVLASAPGMHQTTAEQIVNDHLATGQTEICFRKVLFDMPSEMDLDTAVETITDLEESMGTHVYRDPQ